MDPKWFYGLKNVVTPGLCSSEDKQFFDADDGYRNITFSRVVVEDTSEKEHSDKGVEVDNIEETDYYINKVYHSYSK